jgi:DsbC/DsbD-like thiol-disulfide interchange protein
VALLAFCAGTAAFGASSDPFTTPEGSVRLVSGWLVAPAAADARLGLEFTLAPGWHVYWKNPGDAGYPPAFESDERSTVAVGDILYPAPERFELPGGLVAYGYEEHVVYPIEARLGEEAGERARIGGRLDYLVCAVSCIPYTAELSLDLPVGKPAADPQIAPEIDRWRERQPAAADEALDQVVAQVVRAEGAGLLLRLTLVGADLRAAEPDLFFDTHPLVSFDSPRFVTGENGPGFEVRMRPLDETRPLPEPLHLTWTATGFARGDRRLAFSGSESLDLPSAEFSDLGRITLLALAIVGVTFLTLRWRHRKPHHDLIRR